MKQGRYRWLIRLAILLVAGLGFAFWMLRGRSQNLLLVENRSGQRIALLTLTFAGQTRSFEDMAVGAEVTVPLPVKEEERLVVEGRLANGTLIRGRLGRISGAGERYRLIILPGGDIAFRPPRPS
jgi:hypothetical protein